jgi:hypothetical protein
MHLRLWSLVSMALNAAIDAAIWAIDEAVRRDVPLRIVHVTHIEDQRAATDDDFRLDVQYAELCEPPLRRSRRRARESRSRRKSFGAQ